MIKPPFDVEDYRPEFGSFYVFTLRDTETGEALAPLTSKQGFEMKLLLQLWYKNQQALNKQI